MLKHSGISEMKTDIKAIFVRRLTQSQCGSDGEQAELFEVIINDLESIETKQQYSSKPEPSEAQRLRSTK